MNNKEAIIEAAISLINENEEQLEQITMRQISKRAGVGLGLINYHFESKDKLLEACVERMVNGIVDRFRNIGQNTNNFTPFDKLDYLGNMTLSYLFEHHAISKLSAIKDIRSPSENDNIHRTFNVYIPLVAACRPDWNEEKVRQMTFYLVSCMQMAFLRYEVLLSTENVDLRNPEQRKAYHTKMLKNILGIEGEICNG